MSKKRGKTLYSLIYWLFILQVFFLTNKIAASFDVPAPGYTLGWFWVVSPIWGFIGFLGLWVIVAFVKGFVGGFK